MHGEILNAICHAKCADLGLEEGTSHTYWLHATNLSIFGCRVLEIPRTSAVIWIILHNAGRTVDLSWCLSCRKLMIALFQIFFSELATATARHQLFFFGRRGGASGKMPENAIW